MAKKSQAGVVKTADRRLLQLTDFTGGLNTRTSRFLIKDTQATEIMNFWFGLGGVLRVRPGSIRKTTTSFGAGGIKSGTRYYPATGSAQLVFDHSTSIYKSTDHGQTGTALTLPVSLSAFDRAYYVQSVDLLFRADGVNTPLKYDGTTVTKWGIAAPGSGVTAADGGSVGNVNGTVLYKVTFVTATAESNGNATGTSITVVNRNVSLTNIPTGGTDVTKRRIYRTKNGGAIYYFLTQINDNVTTIYTDDTLDSGLDVSIELPVDNDMPPTDLEFIEPFKNRVFAVARSNLRELLFSELFEPEGFPVDYGVTIPFPEGDKIIGLKTRGDLLFIYGMSTVFVLIGDSPFNFTIRQTFADEGFVAQKAVVEVENVVMGPTRFGFQAFDGANARILSIEIEPTLREEIDLAKLDSFDGAYDFENRVVRWSVPLKSGGRGEVVYDLFRRGWTRSDRSISCYMPLRGAPDRGELLTGDPTTGYIWQENQGADDNGANIVARYRTKTFDFQAGRFLKHLWHIFVDTNPTTGTLAIDVRGDSGDRLEVFSPSLSGSLFFYGDASKKYGDSSRLYGGSLIVSFDDGFTYDPSASKDFLVRHAEMLIQYTGKAEFELYRIDCEFDQESWLRKT